MTLKPLRRAMVLCANVGEARRFSADVLGMEEIPRGPTDPKRKGARFRLGGIRLHLALRVEGHCSLAGKGRPLGIWGDHLAIHGADLLQEPVRQHG